MSRLQDGWGAVPDNNNTQPMSLLLAIQWLAGGGVCLYVCATNPLWLQTCQTHGNVYTCGGCEGRGVNRVERMGSPCYDVMVLYVCMCVHMFDTLLESIVHTSTCIRNHVHEFKWIHMHTYSIIMNRVGIDPNIKIYTDILHMFMYSTMHLTPVSRTLVNSQTVNVCADG